MKLRFEIIHHEDLILLYRWRNFQKELCVPYWQTKCRNVYIHYTYKSTQICVKYNAIIIGNCIFHRKKFLSILSLKYSTKEVMMSFDHQTLNNSLIFTTTHWRWPLEITTNFLMEATHWANQLTKSKSQNYTKLGP